MDVKDNNNNNDNDKIEIDIDNNNNNNNDNTNNNQEDRTYWLTTLEKWHMKLMREPESLLLMNPKTYLPCTRFTFQSYLVFKNELKHCPKDLLAGVGLETEKKEFLEQLEFNADKTTKSKFHCDIFNIGVVTLPTILEKIRNKSYANDFHAYKNELLLLISNTGFVQPSHKLSKASDMVSASLLKLSQKILLELFDLQTAFTKRKRVSKLVETFVSVSESNAKPKNTTTAPQKKQKVIGGMSAAAKAKQTKQEEITRKKRLSFSELSAENKAKFSFEYILNSMETPKRVEIDSIYGMNPNMKLYGYQKASLNRMLEIELNQTKMDDPLYEVIEDEEGDTVYRNIIDKSITNEIPPKINACRGGILCEEMGTGKTIICIALILSTLGSHAQPPDDPSHEWQITQPSIYTQYDNYGNLYPPLDLDTELSIKSKAQTTLFYLCSRYIRMKGIPYETIGLPEEFIEHIEKVPLTRGTLTRKRVSARFEFAPHIKRFIFSGSTLIIAPDQILIQWSHELNKHSTIKYHLIKKEEKVPSAEVLAKYHVVLLSHSKISTTDKISDPLLEVYWLRLIVDEGHVVGSNSTNLSTTSRLIKAERRWVVSGTPVSSTVLSNELANFGSIMRFLQYYPFAMPDFWSKYISRPINKFQPEAVDRLVQLIRPISVRTPLSIIEKDVQLPPLTINVVKVKPYIYEIVKYNEIVFQVQTNLLASQYEGPDSLFSKNNQRFAIEVFTNLRRACFFTVGLDETQRNVCREAAITAILRDDTIIPRVDKIKLLEILRFMECVSVLRDDGVYLLNTENFYFRKKNNNNNNKNTSDNNNINNSSNSSSNNNNNLSKDNDVDKNIKKVRFNMDVKVKEIESNTPSTTTTTTTTNNDTQKNTVLGIINNNKIENHKDIQSSKLIYIKNRVNKIDGKIIIFSQFNEVLYDIVYMFKKELPELRFLQYHTLISQKERANAITTFQTNPDFKVIVMNTDLAAYGINITMATHIIIVDPIMNWAKERQAIKRAHRIGQIKPVFVEKLVAFDIENTITAMVDRDGKEHQSDQQNTGESVIGVRDEFLFQVEKKEEQGKKIRNLLRDLKPMDHKYLTPSSDEELVNFTNFIKTKTLQ